MAALTPIAITKNGVEPEYAAAADGDTLKAATDQRAFLHVKNGGGASINVTVPAQTTSVSNSVAGSLTVPDLVEAVPAGEERMIGPFPPAYVNSSGNVTFNYSSVTSVTMAAFTLAPN